MLEQKLKELITEKYGTLMDFSKAIGIPYATIYSIINRGIQKAGISNVLKICEGLGISADELADGRIVFVPKDDSDSPTVDTLKHMIATSLKLDGTKLSGDEVQTMIDCVDLAAKMIRRMRGAE